MRKTLLLVLLTTSLTPQVHGQATPVGSEFQVNTTTTYRQRGPGIAVTSSGEFLVIWRGYQPSSRISGQRYDSAGSPTGGELTLQTGNLNAQRVASDGGGFLVVWQQVVNQTPNAADVRGHRFDSSGSPQGSSFLINGTPNAGSENQPQVAGNPNGGFVAVWQRQPQTGSLDARARRFSSTGAALGSEINVATNADTPNVAVKPNGEFVVVWVSRSDDSVQGQRFASDGSLMGSAFTATSLGYQPVVDFDGNGGFVVAWGPGYDRYGEIRAQRFNSSGTAIASDFQVSTYNTAYQYNPAIAVAPGGEFTVAWQSGGYYNGPDGSGAGIRGQLFDSGGSMVASEFGINTSTTGYQNVPDVALHGNGQFTVVWESESSAGTDTDTFSVQGQRFSNGAVVSDADLVITKTDAPDPAIAGQTVVYTITVTNNGPADAEDVVVTDTLPAGLTAMSTSGDCAEASPAVPTCTLGTISNGSSKQYILTAAIGSGVTGAVSNMASVTSSTMLINTGDDSVTQDTTVNAQADLLITKTDTPDPVIGGEEVTYTITVTNNGPSDATGVVVTDTLPAGTTATATAGDCAEASPAVPTCTLGSIASGASKQYTLTAAVDSDATGTITNNASVAAATMLINTGDDAVSEDTTVEAEADLVITKTGASDPVTAGESVTYTLTVTNNGPSDATGVVVTDTLPAGTTATATAGDCAEASPAAPTCTLGSIASGASKQYTLTAAVDSDVSGTITNNASVTAATTLINTGDDAVSEDTTVNAEADLVITKTDAPDPVSAGETVTYTLTVTNNGPSDATGVVVTDTLPAGTTATATAGDCAEASPAVPTCTLGSIASGASRQYTLTAAVGSGVSGTITNNASVTAATTLINTGDDAVSEDTTVNAEADLLITKTDAPDPVVASQNLLYTITVQNSGPSDATNVRVTETLPAGVTLVSTAGCAEDPSAIPTCTLGNIADGASAQYTVEVNVDAGTTNSLTNTVAVAADTTLINTGDDSVSEVTSVNAEADLTIAKTDSQDPVSGNTFSYSLQVTNLGPSDAMSVVATDPLPAGLAFAGSADGCTEAAGTVTCGFGDLMASASASRSFDVVLDPPFAASVTNTATVSSATPDPVAGNDTGSETTALDTVPPVVANVDTRLPNGDGTLAMCEVVRSQVFGIIVDLVDDLSPIDGAADPGSYLLVSTGLDGTFSTTGCSGGVAGDDVEIQITDLTLDDADPLAVTSRFDLGTSFGLSPGLYRLLACDTIADSAGNALDGDGDGMAGGDLRIDFRADPLNFFLNGNFDACAGPVTLSPWITTSTPPNDIVPAPAGEDADESLLSGSALISHLQDGSSSLGQCVPIDRIGTLDMRAQLRFTPAGIDAGILRLSCEFFDAPDCGGSSLGLQFAASIVEDLGPVWLPLETSYALPGGVRSGLCAFTIEPLTSTLPSFDLGLDALFIGDSIVFRDGFESGNTSTWTDTTP